MSELHIYDEPPAGVSADWSMPQNWSAFGDDEHVHWRGLIERQSHGLQGLASNAFLRGLDALNLSSGGIPEFAEFNERFKALTGWQAVAVPGVIPNDAFFGHLAARRFPVANFLRGHSSTDYSDEPDMFHDVFGHLPMFIDRTFGDFMAAYGRAGLRAQAQGHAELLGRLYLHTVEFGLIREGTEVRAYGAGLLSSYAETVHAVTGGNTRRLKFDLKRMMRTNYHFDQFQSVYFVIESFEALLEEMETTRLTEVYESLMDQPVLAPGETAGDDVIFEAALHG